MLTCIVVAVTETAPEARQSALDSYKLTLMGDTVTGLKEVVRAAREQIELQKETN